MISISKTSLGQRLKIFVSTGTLCPEKVSFPKFYVPNYFVTGRSTERIRRLRQFSSQREIPGGLVDGGPRDIADRCELHIVSSPYPDIQSGPFPPLYEFVTQDWRNLRQTKLDDEPKGYLDEKIAIVDGSTGQQRTFRDYQRTAISVATALRHDFEVPEHGCVAIFSPNHVDYAPIALGVSLTGAKLTPINPHYTTKELSTLLDRSLSSVLFVHHSVLDVALKAVKESDGSHLKHIIVMQDDDHHSNSSAERAGTIDFNSISELYNENDAVFRTLEHIHPKTDSHTFLLPYSSGTTGLPKGVCLSHSNLVSNLLQCDEVEGLAFAPDHKLISPLPFFHIYAFTVSLMYAAWKGHTLITMSRRFELERFCQLVEQHRPERAHLVPPILLGLAKHPVVDKYDMSSLRTIISAAAPLGTDTESAVEKRLDCCVKQAWGMSELSPIGTLTSDFNTVRGSIGPLAPSTYAKVIDSNGKSLAPNESGELLIKGPQVMMGYLNDPDKTDDCLSRSGWLRTGDLAHYNEDGFFFVTDRIKELIKVRGYQVAPAELEELLLTNEYVKDAAVVQIPDESSGELPRAFVVLEDRPMSKKPTEDDIYHWVKERVAPHKRLDGGVCFVESIPKSASGKILRRILRDRVRDEND